MTNFHFVCPLCLKLFRPYMYVFVGKKRPRELMLLLSHMPASNKITDLTRMFFIFKLSVFIS